jgi:hypothetical protein
MRKGLFGRMAVWVGLYCLVLVCNAAYAGGVNHVLMVQNSGWMLPFYDDPNSKLKDLVVELSGRVAPYGGGAQIVASFNQSFGENESPLLHYKGNDASKLREAIQGIQLARKPGRNTYADTDFAEAIVGAVTKFTPGEPALLWIITNNKNSPDNSVETVKKNKDFYRFLQETAEVKRIVAFPHSMKVQSQAKRDYRANGLMIYVLAYGAPADQVLQQMLAADVPFGQQPARLKPLNAEAMTFVPTGVKGNDVKASLPDRKTLVLSFDASSKPEQAIVTGQFRNDFYPYDIRSANVGLSAAFKGGQAGIAAELSTDRISSVPAGGLSNDVVVKISVPPLPSAWSPEVIFGSGYKAAGMMRFELSDQQLEISKKFTQSMAELFPNDPLPETFIPGASAKNSVTDQPLLIQVAYPILPLFVIIASVLLLLAGLIGGFVAARREKIFRVSVDGVQKTFGMRPGSEVILKNQTGERVGVLKRGFGKPIATLDKGKNCQVRIM